MADQNRNNNNYFIFFAVASVNLITFTAGGCFSWPSPILPKLGSTDPTINPLSKPITTFEQSWIAAVMNLGAAVGPIVGGMCSARFGKKNTLLILGVPMVISHLLCAFAVKISFFITARFLIGIGVGTAFGVIPGYVGEIAEDRNRGVLASLLGVSGCSGILSMYLIGPYLSLRTFSLINIIPMILFYALFGCCVPESPHDLVKRGNQKAARESLIRLRNKTSDQIEKEFVSILDSIKEGKCLQNNGFLSLFKNKAIVKSLIISNGCMFFQQFSGFCAVSGYMQIIFEAAGSSIPPVQSAMIVGGIQLISNIASSQLIDRAGRKILLIISFLFSIVSIFSLGTYFYLKASGVNVDAISWLPIACLVVYITAFNLGLCNIPWVFLAELFPANVKVLASTLASFFVFFLSFVVTICFPYVSVSLGMAGSFWIFSATSVAGMIFCIILIPETKGKSIQEIQNVLEGNKQ